MDKLEEFCEMAQPANVTIEGVAINCLEQKCTDCAHFNKCKFAGKYVVKLGAAIDAQGGEGGE